VQGTYTPTSEPSMSIDQHTPRAVTTRSRAVTNRNRAVTEEASTALLELSMAMATLARRRPTRATPLHTHMEQASTCRKRQACKRRERVAP
jgi:hypothetical protein